MSRRDSYHPRPTWYDEAACVGKSSTMFHPEKGVAAAPAKAICAECPVRQECLDWALEHNEKYGVWGGLSYRERARVAKLRRVLGR